MEHADQVRMGSRRRFYDRATAADIRRYEEMCDFMGGERLQLDGALQFQVLYLIAVDKKGRSDFLNVMPIGHSPTDSGAIDLIKEHHRKTADGGKLWFLRGAGLDGEEIHAGIGHGMHTVTRYRIVMVRTRDGF